MKSDFLLAITQLSAEKNLPKDVVLTAVEAALVSAYKKDTFSPNQNIAVRINPSSGKVEVFLKSKDGLIVYTIDMEKDVVESITFSGDTGGQLQFDYLQEIEGIGSEFVEPGRNAGVRERSEGMLWLLELIRNN